MDAVPVRVPRQKQDEQISKIDRERNAEFSSDLQRNNALAPKQRIQRPNIRSNKKTCAWPAPNEPSNQDLFWELSLPQAPSMSRPAIRTHQASVQQHPCFEHIDLWTMANACKSKTRSRKLKTQQRLWWKPSKDRRHLHTEIERCNTTSLHWPPMCSSRHSNSHSSKIKRKDEKDTKVVVGYVVGDGNLTHGQDQGKGE